MTKQFSDYGPPTTHPHDPRNAPDEYDEWFDATYAALESAKDYINKAIREMDSGADRDELIVTLAMDDAIVELGGVVPKR
jgi:hypothetical protein